MTKQALARQELFFQNLNLVIEKHLAEPDFNVRKLTRAVGTSRTDLHRKLSQQIGMSAVEYLRHVRLKRAATLLLEHPEWCVCQVALEVGFQSPSYFAQKFKEIYGVCPMKFKC